MKYLIFVVLLLLMGCSSPKVHVPQSVHVTLSGFNVTTPPGWQIVDGSRKGVVLNKFTHKEISEVGWALTGDTPTNLSDARALNWVKTEKMADANRDRMFAINNTFAVIKFNGLNCLKYAQTSLDKKADMMLSVTGLACLHPKVPYHFVDLSLSQRYKQGATPFNYSSDSESFYKTLTPTEELYDL